MTVRLYKVFDREKGVDLSTLLRNDEAIVSTVLMQIIFSNYIPSNKIENFRNWCIDNGYAPILRSVISDGKQEPYVKIFDDRSLKYVGYIEVPKDQASLAKKKIEDAFTVVSIRYPKEFVWIRKTERESETWTILGRYLEEKGLQNRFFNLSPRQ